jgi:hypothetical protein
MNYVYLLSAMPIIIPIATAITTAIIKLLLDFELVSAFVSGIIEYFYSNLTVRFL